MKVLHVFNNLIAMPDEGSGEKTHNHFMGQAFNKLGHEMVFFEPKKYSKSAEKTIDSQRNFYRKLKTLLPKLVTDWLRDLYYILYDLSFDKKILEVINKEKPDVIFERITMYHDSGLRAARKAGIPFVIEIHETHDSLAYKDRMNFSFIRKYRWIKCAKKADLVVVVSSMLKEYFVKEGVSPDHIVVLPNAVDLSLFHETGKRDEIRKKLNLTDETVLGFVGGMFAYHGIDMLPDLCRALLKKHTNIKFVLVGSFSRRVDGEEGFRKLLSDKDVEDYFILTGGVPLVDVPGYIEAIDIGLMPDSNEYGSPIKIFEYGSLAKPVVAPKYMPIEDVIVDNRNGMIFEPKSVSDMFSKVDQLIQDKELAKLLGKTLQDDVVNNHTWEKNAGVVIERLGF